MVNFGEKAKIKKAGNLNSGRSYVITTVHKIKVSHKVRIYLFHKKSTRSYFKFHAGEQLSGY